VNIIPFNYEKHEVRTVTIDGEPWFVAKDVCDVLDVINPTQAVERLDEDERAMFNIWRQGETNIVNESGLYALVLGSRKPEAKAFKRWVTHEVIPQIRKTGQYQQKPMSLEEMFALQANINLEFSRRMDNTEQTVKTALKALVAPTQKDWQQTTCDRIKRVAIENKKPYGPMFNNMYGELERSCRVNLSNRVTRAKNRLQAAGATEKDLQAVNKLYVIANDPKLSTAFDGILRRVEARYAQKKVEVSA
jgi:prophage antirepressor-like protein